MIYPMFPEEYYTEEKIVKLTQAEIDAIIEELNRTEHNIFEFLNYGRIIDKLKQDSCSTLSAPEEKVK